MPMRLAVMLLLTAGLATAAVNPINCAADVSGSVRSVLNAVGQVNVAVSHFCREHNGPVCAQMLGYSLAAVGDATERASRAEKSCRAKNTTYTGCGVALGEILSSVGIVAAEAAPSVQYCKQGNRTDCALGAIRPALEGFAVMEGVKHAFERCGGKTMSPQASKFSCLADFAVTIHDLMNTAASIVQAHTSCRQNPKGMGCEISIPAVLANAGFTAIRASKAAFHCKERNTNCSRGLAELAQNIGSAGILAVQSKFACKDMSLSCALSALSGATELFDVAKSAQDVIAQCRKEHDATEGGVLKAVVV